MSLTLNLLLYGSDSLYILLMNLCSLTLKIHQIHPQSSLLYSVSTLLIISHQLRVQPDTLHD